MTILFAESAFIRDGWRKNVRIGITAGLVSEILVDAEPQPGDERHAVIVPGMGNLHSHAFQRAMAGLAEMRGPSDDSFWSWRNVMYKFALSMTPEHVEAVAAQLYVEMLEAGFTRVGEFHYLHHDQNGAHYSDIAELASRIAGASAEAGIGLTLLPVFYAHAGFGGLAPADGQRRFINSPDSFSRLMDRCRDVVSPLAGARLGVAPHSLRAVTPEELEEIVSIASFGPIHIHVAEQTKEVEDCLAWSGARPVQWLMDNAPVDERWCLIHATHMDDAEIDGMARSGAIAGLCPITEANLGDGTFAARRFIEHGGRYGIGSDSNIDISPARELRQLEYSQRILHQSRNVIADAGQSTGQRMFTDALQGGSLALGGTDRITTGERADLVSLDTSAISFLQEAQIIDQWIFASGVRVDTVWTAGEKQVIAGRHRKRDAIRQRFQTSMRELLAS